MNPYKNRSTNIELLRILAMIMIVTMHALGKGGVLEKVTPFSINYYLVQYLEGMFFVAVNVFVLISGYFLINSNFKGSNLLNIILEVQFYSISIFAIMVFLKIIPFSYKELFYSLFPILTRQYWFITVYFALYIIFPYLNKFIESLSQSRHFKLIIILTFLFSVWPTIIFFEDSLNIVNGYSLLWFIFLYFTGSYIRKYYETSYKPLKYFLLYVLIGSLVPLSRFLIALITKNLIGEIAGSGFFYRYNSILVLISSLSLFIAFLNIEIKSKYLNKIILDLSPLTLAVYIIHTNPYLKEYIWLKIGLYKIVDEVYLIINIILAVILVYFVCIMIEIIRKFIFRFIVQMKYYNDVVSFIDRIFKTSN